MKRTMFCALLLLVPITAFSESFSGKWLLETETWPFGRLQSILELSQVGEKVTGTLSVVPGSPAFSLPTPTPLRIYGGRINGKTLIFYVWTRGDEPRKDIYKGLLTEKGEISFEVERGVGPPRAVPPNPNGGEGEPPPPAPSRVTAVPIL